jgi:hypothetical protein
MPATCTSCCFKQTRVSACARTMNNCSGSKADTMHALLRLSCSGGRSGRALVVVPTNVVKNWGEEFSKWLPSRNDPDYTASMLQCSGHKIITVRLCQRQCDYAVVWVHVQGRACVQLYSWYHSCTVVRVVACLCSCRHGSTATAFVQLLFLGLEAHLE